MQRVLVWLFVLAVCCSAAFAGNGVVWPARDPIAGEYIVVLADQRSSDVAGVARQLVAMHGGDVIVSLHHGVKMFGLRHPNPAAVEALARNPLVDHVEQNGKVFLSQTSYTVQDFGTDESWWHLDRLDNRGPLYSYHAYAYTSTGHNVNVYVLDTGILGTHEQFDGRVLAGATYGDTLPANNPCGGFPTNPFDAPGYGPGHGTAVASVVGGNTNGVAKNVTLIPVKVLNCDPPNGLLYGGNILWNCWGLDWILADATSFANANRRSVVTTSLFFRVADVQNQQCQTSPDPNSPTTPCLPAFENNVRNLVMHGITVVASANNQNNGNCDTSPARMGYGNTAYDFHTITVGGSTEQDQRWVRLPNEQIPNCTGCNDTGSNFGACVDIYAPAQHLWHLANISANNAYRTRLDQLSGTSFAAPIVAGIAARLLEHNAWLPAQVWQYIRDNANHPGCFDTTVTPCNDRLAYISPYD
jgi:subtilisin family serine protease